MKPYLSWTLRIIIAIIYLQTLFYKFTAHPESVHIFSALGIEPYGRIGLGIMELIIAFLILIPKLKIYGIMFSLGIISGAIFSHLLVIGINVSGDGGTLFILAIIVFLSTLSLIIMHKADLVRLVEKVKQRLLKAEM